MKAPPHRYHAGQALFRLYQIFMFKELEARCDVKHSIMFHAWLCAVERENLSDKDQ